MTAHVRSEQTPYDAEALPPNPLQEMWDRWRGTVVPIVLVVLTLLVFSTALGNDWVQGWDDDFYITANSKVDKFSPANIINGWTHFRRGEYIPLSLTFYSVEHLVFGDSPAPYHLINVLFHAANGILVYLCLSLIQNRQMVAVGTALIFLVHPVQVESVAWISQQKTILSGFFFLLALWLHLQGTRKKPLRGALWLSYAAFGASLLCKPMAVLAPILFIVFDYNWTRMSFRTILLRNLAYVVMAIGGAILVILAQNANGGLTETGTDGVLKHGQLVLWAVWDYFASLIAPLNLNNLYIYDLEKVGFGNLRMWLGLVMIIVSIALALLWKPLGRRFTALAVLWFWIFLLPLLNIISIGYPRADRFLYLPVVMFAALLTMGFAQLWERFNHPGIRTGIGVVLGGFILMCLLFSLSRNRVWENIETLMRDHINDYPNSVTGLNKLSRYYMETGNLNEAARMAAILASDNPNDPTRLNQLALIAMAQENYNAATELYAQVVQLQPDDQESKTRLGIALVQWGVQLYDQGDYDGALTRYIKALDYIPNEPTLHNNIGFTFYTQGKNAEAIIAYNEAITLKPDYTKAWMNLGDAALNSGNYELARNAYVKATELNAQFNPRSASNFCLALGELGQNPEVAIQFCQLAINQEPDNGLYLGRTAHVLLIFGQYQAALEIAQRAVQIQPDLVLNQRVLGDAYRFTGNAEGARQAYTAALALNPNNVESQQGLEALNQATGTDSSGQ